MLVRETTAESDEFPPLESGSRSAEAAPAGNFPMEIYISRVLQVGVLIAAVTILTGLILYVTGVGPASESSQQLNQLLHGSGGTIPVSLRIIWRGVANGDPISIIQLGVLALILTPMTRVAMTAILFLTQRDRVFVVITTVVFLVLVLGLVGVGS